jgi:hypothetical protein
MRIVISILQKVLVNHFYKVNAGLFLFGFFVLFGLPYQPLSFHLSLITGIIQSGEFLAVVMLIWLLYNVKCVDYILKQLRLPSQLFLFSLNSLSNKKIYLYMLYVQVQVYMPIIIYAGVIAFMAAKKYAYASMVLVILFNISTVAITAFIYFISLQKKTFLNVTSLSPDHHLNFKKPFFLIPLYHIWYDRKQMLFISKLFSLGFLYGFFNLYEPDHYDIRPLQLCLLLVVASQTAMVFQIKEFEEEYLSFYRNLPLKTTVRFAGIAVMYALLLLPEFILLWKGYGVHFLLADYPQLILLPVALLCIFHVTLYLDNINMDQFMRIVFGALATCFFILLYNPGVVFAACILILAFVLYHSYYYDYEKKYN